MASLSAVSKIINLGIILIALLLSPCKQVWLTLSPKLNLTCSIFLHLFCPGHFLISLISGKNYHCWLSRLNSLHESPFPQALPTTTIGFFVFILSCIASYLYFIVCLLFFCSLWECHLYKNKGLVSLILYCIPTTQSSTWYTVDVPKVFIGERKEWVSFTTT